MNAERKVRSVLRILMQETEPLQMENQKNEKEGERERESRTRALKRSREKTHSRITRHKVHQHPPNSNPDR